jgi:hypothetical protein
MFRYLLSGGYCQSVLTVRALILAYCGASCGKKKPGGQWLVADALQHYAQWQAFVASLILLLHAAGATASHVRKLWDLEGFFRLRLALSRGVQVITSAATRCLEMEAKCLTGSAMAVGFEAFKDALSSNIEGLSDPQTREHSSVREPMDVEIDVDADDEELKLDGLMAGIEAASRKPKTNRQKKRKKK